MCNKEGIDKTYFYHLRDELKRPVVTICLLKDYEGKIHRGVSICSVKDIPRKIVGRGIAFGRALSAYNNKASDNEGSVSLRYEAIEVLESITEPEMIPVVDSYLVKSVYNAELTDFERKLTRT